MTEELREKIESVVGKLYALQGQDICQPYMRIALLDIISACQEILDGWCKGE